MFIVVCFSARFLSYALSYADICCKVMVTDALFCINIATRKIQFFQRMHRRIQGWIKNMIEIIYSSTFLIGVVEDLIEASNKEYLKFKKTKSIAKSVPVNSRAVLSVPSTSSFLEKIYKLFRVFYLVHSCYEKS